MTNQKEGFIVLQRKIEDWQYFNDPYGFYIWTHILIKANWKDGWFMGQRMERGSFATSYKNFADECGVGINTIRRWLKKFEEAGQIEAKTTNRYTKIIVINYGKYQDQEQDVGNQEGNQEGKQVGNQEGKQVGNQEGNNRTKEQCNKETNKQKNIEREPSPQFLIPSESEIKTYIKDQNLNVDPDVFCSYYNSNGWMVGKNKMKDWKETLKTWSAREKMKPHKHVDLLPKYMTDPESIPAEAELTEEEINEIKKLQQSMSRKNANVQ